MMRFASLGSGSSGNALLIESDGTLILLDCGFGLAEATARLARAGVEPDEVDAIIVTHEHEDHGGGVAKLASSFDITVYLTRGTLSGLGADGRAIPRKVLIDPYTAFAVNGVEVRPFPVPHDAREPVQFVVSNGAARLGVLTDILAHTLGLPPAVKQGLLAEPRPCRRAEVLASILGGLRREPRPGSFPPPFSEN